jgi:myo-inositol 2-dehydrogenase/D-chiro-inositol 1-dehydrogenase
MKTLVNLAIVGAGKAGANHAAAFAACGRARITRVVSRTAESARKLAEAVSTPEYGDRLEDVLEDPRIDAVVVASPDKYHHGQAAAALRKGKHVLVEKPMCRSAEEARDMIAAARETGALLMVGFVERFNHPFAEAIRRIDEGEIGRPVMILARRCHTKAVVRGRSWLNDEETGGVLSYAGTHNIDLVCRLMGSRPKRVYCESGKLVLPREQNFTDCAVMTFLFENGGIAALYESFGYPDTLPSNVDRSIEVLGDRGSLKIDMMDQPLTVYSGAAPVLIDSVTWPVTGGQIGGAIVEQARRFVSCILDGTQVPTPGETGLEAILIAAAAREAARTGRAVDIEGF